MRYEPPLFGAAPIVERLEGRLLLTTANVVGTQLVVTGSSLGEVIEIFQKSSTNQVTVRSGFAEVSNSPFSITAFSTIKVNAGSGNDEIWLGSTAWGTGDIYDTSFDVPVSKAAEVHGDAGNDTVYGTDQADTLEGEAGLDTLHGAAGNDTIRGEDDDDDLFGQSGNDVMYGGYGYDALDGGIDNDLMYGGNGAVDNDGGDTLFGGTGDDRLYGEAGNDSLRGDDGADYMYGGDGNDSLDSRGQDFASDTLDGGLGDDYGRSVLSDGDTESNIEFLLP